MDKEKIQRLKSIARKRTSKENEQLNPLNMSLKDLGYSREESYNLGFDDCDILASRKILDIMNIKY